MRPDTESEFKKGPGGIIMSTNIFLSAEYQLMYVLYVYTQNHTNPMYPPLSTRPNKAAFIP